MLELLVFLITAVLAIGLCLNHHSMRTKLLKTNVRDCEFVRKAAEHSIAASNTVNPVLAMVDTVRAVQLIESLHERYGVDLASEVSQTDTEAMLETLQNQKERIVRKVMRISDQTPSHPLNESAHYTRKEHE